MPASIGSTRCTSAGPAPFFACVRCALAVLFVIGGSLAPGVGDRLSWSTRFSRRPGSRRYSVLKFNTGRDIPSALTLGTNEGLTIGDSAAKLAQLYGSGMADGSVVRYGYADTNVEAKVTVRAGKVVEINVLS